MKTLCMSSGVLPKVEVVCLEAGQTQEDVQEAQEANRPTVHAILKIFTKFMWMEIMYGRV